MNNFEIDERKNGLEIAIVGMLGRFPGAKNVDQFWQNLRDGVGSISFFTNQDLEASGISPAVLSDPNYVKARGILEDIELFDASFFNMNHREAEITDPQQRLFLECAWEALENAGYDAETYNGSIGVYAGVGRNTYLLNLYSNPGLIESVGSLQTSIGNEKDHLTTRVSYKLNLKGPAVTVQTACSTSLVAVYLACQGLLSGACDMALAGGVSIVAQQKAGYFFQEEGIFSPDGHCRAFDAKARGTVFSNGLGIVVLKRLDDALADGDYINAIIKGAAINNDGSLKVGYTAPSVDRQAEVIAMAQALAEVEAETITYVETHGTGTTLGDAIEIAALTQVFRSNTKSKGFCAIGSVKTNVGHLNTAAGVAGLIKTVLALKYKSLPPSLHFEQPNPKVDFANSPFYVNTELSEWKMDKTPRRAGVSSFGMGGTNAHVVLEEAPPRKPSGDSRPWQLLLISAKTSSALDTATANLAEHLNKHPDINLADVAYTLSKGRGAFSHRRILVCQNLDNAAITLNTLDSKRAFTHSQEPRERPVVFMFSGQGAQYVNMGLELYQVEPTFREQVDFCSEILKPHLGLDLRHVLYPGEERIEEASQQLKQTAVAQPALFVISYALARLWMEWSVRPQVMIGHSIGEYVAACLAGVFSLEDALALLAARGEMMQQLPGGAMLTVALPKKEVQPLLSKNLYLAAINGPSLCVISGLTDAVDALQNRLAEKNIGCRRLHTSHAFHSEMMDSILTSFTELVKKVRLKPPQIPYVSNVTGDWITTAEATEPSYWARHLRQTVRFADGVQQLLKDPDKILLEVGPGRTLSTLAIRHPDKSPEQVVLSSLRHPHDRQSDVAFLLNTLGKLWLYSVEVDWTGFYAHESRHRLPLPTYPFELQRYWIEPQKHPDNVENTVTPLPAKTLQPKKLDIADWFYIPSWKRSFVLAHQPGGTPARSCFLVFIDECGLGSQLVKQLELQGRDVITVMKASVFSRLSDRKYTVNPIQGSDYDALLNELRLLDNIPKTIVHLWSITANSRAESRFECVDKAQDLGFYSLLFIVQAFGKLNSTDKFQIMVVSNNMHEVTGEELLCPEKATMLGPVKVIPQEYPNISCRSIDVVTPKSGNWQEQKLIDQLLAEITVKSSDQIIAYRGNHRWLQTFEPVRLDKQGEATPQLREGGAYLITGGLGGIGLVLAEHLAMSVRAKLILTGRSSFPAREEWDRWLATHDEHDNMCQNFRAEKAKIENKINIDMEGEVDYINQIEEEIEREIAIKKYEGFEETANELCSSYIYDYFKIHKINTGKGKIYNKEDLRQKLKILPKFEKFYDFFIKVLSEDKIIKVEDNKTEFLKDKNEIKDPRVLRKEAGEQYPEFEGLFRLLEHCVNHYSEALSGEIEAISVLYPEGRSDLLEDTAKNTAEYSNKRLYAILLRDIISNVVRNSAEKKVLRILEVGAGDGNLTKLIVPSLKKQNIEYYFTDIGKSFLIKAEKKATKNGFRFMRFGVLDISKDPVKQGYERYSFDLILGLNVVHATKSIKETVGHLKNLLLPDGIMFLIETVKLQRWVDMIWGLAEGWWYFEDEDIRRISPLLSLSKWEAVLHKQGFRSVRAYPQSEEKRLETDCGLIIAQQKIEETTNDYLDWNTEVKIDGKQRIPNKIRKLKELEQLGAEVLVLSADVSDMEQMHSVITQAYERFGEIHGVIHAAAIEGGGTIQLKTFDLAKSELASKMRGTMVLDAIFKDVKLDFLVLCSSIVSLSGGVGQVGYCSANAFLDAFAHYKANRHGKFIVSINWGRWQNVGLAVAVEARHKEMTGEELTGGITPKEGVDAFSRILARNTLPQVIVSTRDFYALVRQARTLKLSSLGKRPTSVTHHSRPNLKNVFVAPRNEIERNITNIWQEVLGVQQIGIHDNFTELGGDSLIAIQVISRLRELLRVELTVPRLFEAPTVADLAETLIKFEAVPGQVAAIARLRKKIDGMSPDEMRVILRDKGETGGR